MRYLRRIKSMVVLKMLIWASGMLLLFLPSVCFTQPPATVAPIITGIPDIVDGYVNAVRAADGIVVDGIGPTYSLVKVYINGIICAGTGDTGNNGVFQVVVAKADLGADGAKTLYATATEPGFAESVPSNVFNFILDTSDAPSCSISSIVESSDYAYVSGSTIYYNTAYTGSFTVNVTATDSESGIEKVNFPDTVSSGGDDNSLPYSFTYDWNTSDTFSGSANITCYNNAGVTSTAALTVVRDFYAQTAPVITETDYTSIFRSTRQYVSGTCPGGTTSIEVNGSRTGVVLDGTNWSWRGVLSVNPDSNNENIFTIVAKKGEFISPSSTITITLDVTDDPDKDGIPTYWEYDSDPELDYLVHDGNIDSDGDGMTNYQEFLANTNSLDSSSLLKITDIIKSGNNLTLQFPTNFHRNYTIYYSDEKYSKSMTWTAAEEIQGTGATYSWTDNGSLTGGTAPLDPGIAHRYYKIVAKIPPGYGPDSSYEDYEEEGAEASSVMEPDFHTWYLAEGATLGRFNEWVLIMNPTGQDAQVKVTFMKEDGSTVERYITVSATSRYTIDVNSIVPGEAVSTKVESLNGVNIMVERSMYWDDWSGGHNSIGVREPAGTWYLPEGCTDGMETWVLIMNPNNKDAEVKVTFMKPDGSTVEKYIIVPKTSRYTIDVNKIVPGESVSTKVESTNGVPITVERAMYWNDKTGGHNSTGIKDLSTIWYLAEGCTKDTFSEWILIMNPDIRDADVKVTFMKPDSSTIEKYITVPATSRYTIDVNSIVPNESVSAKVESTNGVLIAVERSMYWNDWAGGHNSIGVTEPAGTWYLAEGCTKGTFSEWVLIMNPNNIDAQVMVTFMLEDGSTVQRDITVPATSRYTIDVNSIVPDESLSTKVESTNRVPVIVERAMYWDADGVHWKGGHCSIGIAE